MKKSSLALIFEGLGTAMLTFLLSNYYQELAAKPCTSGVGPQNIESWEGCQNKDTVGLLLGIFVIMIMSFKISGSHYNPCITLAYMLGNVSDGKKFNRLVGFLYIGAQFGAACGGALLARIFTSGKKDENKFSLAVGEGDGF